MIYTGLEIGSFFEVPFTSPCHVILKGVNPLLQMIFTFMQMYFIFMNSRVIVSSLKLFLLPYPISLVTVQILLTQTFVNEPPNTSNFMIIF